MRDVWAPGFAEDTGETYAAICAGFRFDVPATFNFGQDVVDRWARERDGPALAWENAAGEERRLTYLDVSREMNRLANVLRAQGLAKGDRVLVMLPRLPEWMIAMVAVMKLGAVPIPCIEMLTARDLAYRVENSDARAVICRPAQTAKFDALLEALPIRIALGAQAGWVDWGPAVAAASDVLEPVTVAAEDPAVMYYTLGSTGHPKGVVHAARAIYLWRISALYWLDLRPGDTIWCTADTGWSKAGTSILFGPWSCGACTFLYDGPFEPAERLRLLAKHGVTVYCAPGTELFRLVNEDLSAHDLRRLRRTVSGGESVNPVVAERWKASSGVRIDEGYGQTEALMLILNYPHNPVKYGSMGRPIPGSTIAVIDESGRPLPPGEEGTVAILQPNPQMMLGYWKDEERTRSCYLDTPHGRWFLTGDRAATDEDGYFWYRGRSDDIINSAGYRIGPLEVENALLEHPAVQSCAVVGSPDRERGELVKAFVILRDGYEGSDALTRELQDHVKTVTAPYKYPRAIEYMAELPLTVSDKIKRRDLRDREYARGVPS